MLQLRACIIGEFWILMFYSCRVLGSLIESDTKDGG
jgi:hypothetical protein